ncbi:hypothetical protein [Helicobacter suis]|uniref:Uncharacterized protein n=1 Tax=Helicobacter suis TaxID=104628 RepID=A0A6J4CZM9_9HELI|nr:hypothetical protein [Helicobacter suis]BCD45420.1 hypothetical protein NHP190020_04590 [Helicobacter suis]BCD47116.1 hypothetical protein NHP194003_03200 [Helicobacter suis]BCD50655.1 hypothetical protein NHP194022_03260 [Helicobacter suis]BCD70173.1 hypothetical protein SNTW_08180 [Helicobacter suis]BDR27644.1 hypothetical protein HSHS1_04050 [Helicobacter suis HS1]
MKEGVIATYEQMQNLGSDCVVVEKMQEKVYPTSIRLGNLKDFYH